MIRRTILLTIICAGSLLPDLAGPGNVRGLPAQTSGDASVLWNSPVRVSADSLVPTSPGIIAANGSVHLIWYGFDTTLDARFSESGLRYSRSLPGSETFTSPVTLLPSTQAFGPGQLTAAGGRLFVAAAAYIDPLFGVALLTSGDGGVTWSDTIVLEHAFPELLFSLDSVVFIQYKVDSNESRGIIRSTDGGANWEKVADRLRPFSDAADADGELIAVGPSPGGSQNEVGFFTSVDSGRFWFGPEIVSPDDPVRSSDARIAVGGSGNYHAAWIDTGTVFLRSSRNRGISWGTWGPLSSEPGSASVDLEASGKFVFGVWGRDISDTNGIRGRFSNDFGETFGPVIVPGGDGAAEEPVVALRDSTVRLAWVQTSGDTPGVWFREGVLPGGGGGPAGPPETYTLSQSYPNPTNGTAVIGFGVPVGAPLTINLYNVLGERIGVVAAGDFDPGRYEVSVDVSALPSGVYFYRLTADGVDAMKKLLVLR